MKTEVIRLRVTPELKEAISKLAKKENRTMSNYIENLIIKATEREEQK